MNVQSNSIYFSLAIESNDTQRKLCSFKHLAPGWHYGEGGPIDSDTIRLACQINKAAYFAGFRETDAFPGLDGCISLTIYHCDDFYELILNPEGKVTFVHERGSQELMYLQSISVHKAIALIEEFSPLLWKTTYESFTKITTTEEKNGSAAPLSPAVMESPSSVKCASNSRVRAFVTTSEPITMTHGSQAIPLFFGNSRQNNSPQMQYLSKKQPLVEIFATTTSKIYIPAMLAA